MSAYLRSFVPLQQLAIVRSYWVIGVQTFFSIFEKAVSFTSTNCYYRLAQQPKGSETNHLELVKVCAKLF